MVECGVSGADCSMYESGHNDEPSLVWVHDKSFENPVGTKVTTDSMGQQNQNCSDGKQVGDFISCGIFELFNSFPLFVFPFSFYNILDFLFVSLSIICMGWAICIYQR